MGHLGDCRSLLDTLPLSVQSWSRFKKQGETELSNSNVLYTKYKYYSNIHEAIDSITCKEAVIPKFDSGNTIFYDFDPYLCNRKVVHRHIADAKNISRVFERVAKEKRLIENWDPNDYHYMKKIVNCQLG
jgi:hypothetical protein